MEEFDIKNLLQQGVELLKESDKDIHSLVTARQPEIFSLLKRYVKEIELFNAAYGLVAVKNTEELVIKHIFDSLAPLGIINRLAAKAAAGNVVQIADIGSGAGLPGIPLAIAMPHCHFTLIERMDRRAGFLWNVKAVLGLSNITVEQDEVENTKSGYFNVITFRAFKPLEPKLLAALFKIGAEKATIAAYKGRREKIEEEMAPLEKLCGKWDAIPCNVPFLKEERHLLTIEPPIL